MKPWLRRTAIGIGVLLLIAVLLPLIAVVALQHDQVRSVAVDRILDDVNEELAGTVDVDRVEGSLLGHARLENVRITDARGNHAAQLETVSVDFRLRPLLSRTVVIDELDVDTAQAVARTYDDDILNWNLVIEPAPVPEPAEPLDWSVHVDRITLAGAEVAYLDETMAIDDEVPGLATWRQARIDDLDDATGADELRRRWNEGFDPDEITPLAGPRAPIAVWMTSLEADATLEMEGFDIAAELASISADFHSDIVARSLDTDVGEVAFAMGKSTIVVEVDDVELDRWLRGRDIALGVLIAPRDQPPPDGDDDAAFESVVVDLGQWHLMPSLFDWAAPQLPPIDPLELSGRVALDPRDLVFTAELAPDEAPPSVKVSLIVDDYAKDVPEYRATLRAPDFRPHHWVDDDALPDATTSVTALAVGRGLELEDMDAALRLRLDDTTVDDYEADLVYADLDFDGRRFQGHHIAALTPYFDLAAAFELDMDGRATLQARTTAEEHHDAGSPQFADYRPDRADISVDADLSFDPDRLAGDDPLEAFRHIEASASWDIAGVDADDMAAAHSAGRLAIDAEGRTADGPFTVATTYDVEASGRSIQFQDHHLGSFLIRDRGRATVAPLEDDPFDAIIEFANDATLTAAGVHTPELRLRRARLSMETTDPGRPADSADLRLSATLADVRTADADIGDLEGQLDGVLQFGAGRNALETLSGHADVQATDVAVADVTVESVGANFDDIRIDFGPGEPPIRAVATALRAEASGLSFPDGQAEVVEDVDAEIALDLGTAPETTNLLRHVDIDARASIADITVPEYDGAVASVDLRADLHGPYDAPEGIVGAEASEIGFAGEFFPEASLEIAVDGDRRRGRALAAVIRGDDEGYHLRTDFAFEPHYRAGEAWNLRVGTDRMSWQAPEDGLLRWTGERIEARDFSLHHDEQSIAVDGAFHPDVDQDIELAVDVDFEEIIDGFYLAPYLPDLQGHLEGTLHLGGTHSAPTMASTLELRGFHYRDIGPFAADMRATYEDELFWLHRLDIDAFDESLLEGSGRLRMSVDLDGEIEVFPERHSTLRARLHPQQLRRFHRPFPVLNDYGVDGTAGFYLDWAGTLEDPEIEITAAVHDFRFQGDVMGDFIDIRDMDMEAELDYHSVRRGGDGLQSSIDVTWERAPSSVDDPSDEDEMLSLSLDTEWTLEDWLVVIAEGDIDDLSWDDEFLSLPFEFGITVPTFDLSEIPMESLDDLMGEIELDAHLQGPLEDPGGHLDLSLEALGWSSPITEWNQEFRNFDLDLHARIEEQTLAVDTFDLRWMDRDISSAEGTVPLPIPTLVAGEPLRDLPLDFQWTFYEREIRDFDAISVDLYGYMAGSVGAELELAGSLRAPELSAQIGVYDTALGDDNRGSLELEVGAEDNRIEVDGQLTRDETPIVTVDGHAPVLLDMVQLSRGADWQLPGDINLDVTADRIELAEVVPVDLVSDFIVDPEGILTLNVDIGGTWESPAVDGNAELEDGSATLPEFARGFENINARLDLDARAFVLEHLEVHDGPSSLEASGTITHERLVPGAVDLSAEADDFNLVGIATDFPVFTSGSVLIAGEALGDPGELEIDVHDLVVRLTDEWDRTLHATDLDPDIVILDDERRAQIAEMVDEEADEIDGFHLNADIVVHRPAVAHHPAGTVTFDADLTAEVLGTMVAVGGTVDLHSGDLEFLGRRFMLQPSEITFIGDIPPNPRLNIEAHHELERVIVDAIGSPRTGEPRIEFHVSGTATEPRLQLEADPAMTDTEILFVLMTGRPPDRTDVGRDEGIAAQALSAVSGVFLGLLEDELAGTVPVDVLRLEPAVPGTRGGRLEVGRYLLPDLIPNLFFSWRHQFGADEDVAGNVWRLEYHFHPRWMFEGRYTDLNEVELNIFWDAY